MRELQSIRPLDPDFVPTLIELLAHDELKEHAAFAMASLGTEIADGLPALVRHLTIDPNASQLIWCFLGPPDRDRPPDYFALHDEIRNPRLAPRGDRRQAQRMLAQALPTVGPLEVRAAIARELRDSDDPSVRRHLVPLLESPETAIEAAQGLLLQGGKVGKRAEDLLLEAIRKSDDGTPVFVVPAEMAVRWLRDPNRQVRDAATKGRVEIRQWTPAAKAALAKVLAEGDADAKLRVIWLSARLPVATPELERALRSVLTGPHVELHGWAAAVLVDLDVVDDRLAEPMTAGMLRKWTMNDYRSPDLPGWPERLAPVAMRSAETEDADIARMVLLALLRQGPAAAPMVPRLVALRSKPGVGGAVDWVLDGIVTETFADRCKRLRTELRTAPDADPADDAPSICMFPVRLRDSVADLQRRAVKKADDGSGAVFGYSKPLAVFGVDGALAAIGSPEAIAAIIKRAGDPLLDDVERTSAVRVLPYVGTAGLPAADAVKRVLESQPRFAVRVLAGIGAEIPDELLQRAARSDNQVENIPEIQLGSIGRAPPAVPKLLRYLGFGVDAALGDRGPAAAAALVPVLREVLTGKSEAMRTQALHAVNMLEAGTEPLLGELIACLDSREPMVVAGASYALARLGPAAAPAVPRLRRLRHLGHDPMPTAVALGGIGSPEAVSILRRMLDDAEGHVRTAGCVGLWYAGPKTAPAIATLRVLTDDPAQALLACETLLRVAPGRAARWVLPVLTRSAESFDPGMYMAAMPIALMGECGPAAVPHLVRLLDRRGESVGHPHQRIAVLKALGRFGPEAAEALPALRSLRSHDWTVRAMKAAAIARIRRRVGPCVELLRESLRGMPVHDELLAAIAECGEAAALADFTWAPDADVRRQATEALGSLPLATEITGRHLAARLDDTDPEVRFAAAHAFHRLGPAARPALPALRELEAIDDPHLRETVSEVRRAIEAPR